MTASETGQVEILELANRVKDKLLAGDVSSAMRLVEPVMAREVPASSLHLLGQQVARQTAHVAPGAFLALLDGVAKTKRPNAWPFIGTAIYAAFARKMLPSAMQHARRHVTRAATPEAADVISERVPGRLLINYFEEGLSQLYDWVSDPSPWVRRALGVAVHVYVRRHPRERAQVARLLQLLALLYDEPDADAIQGIGQGFETIGRHQPEMLTYWLYEQREADEQPHPSMLAYITRTLHDLPDEVKAALAGTSAEA